MTIFGGKMTLKSGIDFFLYEIEQTPSEIPANLQGQFSLSGPIFLHWAATTLKGLVQFQNKKNLDHYSPSFLSQKWSFQESTYKMSSRWCELGLV